MNNIKNKNKIIIELLNIFNLMSNEKETIDICDFLDEIEKYCNENNIEEYKDVSKQSDCNEFLIFLLNVIHKLYSYKVSIKYTGEIKTDNDKLAVKSIESLSNNFKNEFSFIIPLFYGQYYSNYNNNFNFDHFNHIYLNIDNKCNNIYDCFELFIKDELINDKKKTLSFWYFPKILIICFNKYNNKKLIDYPLENLDLNKYAKAYKKDCKFNLLSIVNHIGNSYGGHYYMYNIYKNKCVLFNDDKVNDIDINDIDKQNTYMLIYKKILNNI
tara:strand:+ start:2527 stop:3339 length:813 start_codon:yes stop_codon:yes gene_type:complete